MSNEIRAIRNEADYQAALARIDELMDSELDTPEGNELDVLTDLVELYEDKRMPMIPRRSAHKARRRLPSPGRFTLIPGKVPGPDGRSP
jgi:HTH-type transcriptional regulator/antitoxin HigA